MRNSHMAHSIQQAPRHKAVESAPPSDATAQCKDDTYSRDPNAKTACAKHGGVKHWYGPKHAIKHVVKKPHAKR